MSDWSCPLLTLERDGLAVHDGVVLRRARAGSLLLGLVPLFAVNRPEAGAWVGGPDWRMGHEIEPAVLERFGITGDAQVWAVVQGRRVRHSMPSWGFGPPNTCVIVPDAVRAVWSRDGLTPNEWMGAAQALVAWSLRETTRRAGSHGIAWAPFVACPGAVWARLLTDASEEAQRSGAPIVWPTAPDGATVMGVVLAAAERVARAQRADRLEPCDLERSNGRTVDLSEQRMAALWCLLGALAAHGAPLAPVDIGVADRLIQMTGEAVPHNPERHDVAWADLMEEPPTLRAAVERAQLEQETRPPSSGTVRRM